MLVLVDDAERATLLASVLDTTPHDVNLQVAHAGARTIAEAVQPSAVAEAFAGARLAGVTGISFSEGGTLMGMRIKPHVSVHASEESRGTELDELLSLRAGASLMDGFSLRVTTKPLPTANDVVQVIQAS